jgi:hypothetical protein
VGQGRYSTAEMRSSRKDGVINPATNHSISVQWPSKWMEDNFASETVVMGGLSLKLEVRGCVDTRI